MGQLHGRVDDLLKADGPSHVYVRAPSGDREVLIAEYAALVESVREIARVVDRLADEVAGRPEGWLGTARAAEYLDCAPARVHDLVALGKLTPARDGRRLLFRRDDLDAYLSREANDRD